MLQKISQARLTALALFGNTTKASQADILCIQNQEPVMEVRALHGYTLSWHRAACFRLQPEAVAEHIPLVLDDIRLALDDLVDTDFLKDTSAGIDAMLEDDLVSQKQ